MNHLSILLFAFLAACGAKATDWDGGVHEAGTCTIGSDSPPPKDEDLLWCFATEDHMAQTCYTGPNAKADCESDPARPPAHACGH